MKAMFWYLLCKYILSDHLVVLCSSSPVQYNLVRCLFFDICIGWWTLGTAYVGKRWEAMYSTLPYVHIGNSHHHSFIAVEHESVSSCCCFLPMIHKIAHHFKIGEEVYMDEPTMYSTVLIGFGFGEASGCL